MASQSLLRLLCLPAPRGECTIRVTIGIFWGRQWPGNSTIQSCLGHAVLQSPVTAVHTGSCLCNLLRHASAKLTDFRLETHHGTAIVLSTELLHSSFGTLQPGLGFLSPQPAGPAPFCHLPECLACVQHGWLAMSYARHLPPLKMGREQGSFAPQALNCATSLQNPAHSPYHIS